MVSYAVGENLTVGIEQLWPLAVFPVAVAVLAVLVFWNPSESRSASSRSRRLLFASRVVVAFLLVVGAMGPYTLQTRATPGEPRVTLLDDESASMAVYQNTTDDLVADIEAEGVPVARATIGSGTDSRLGDGIAANLRENGTVVVVSDGQVTEGRSLASVAGTATSLNATVSAVDISATRTERAVTVDGPQTASQGLETRFTVSMTGVETADAVPVTVTIDGEPVETDELRAGQTLSVTHTFESLGAHRVTATIDGEDVYDRNDVFYHSVRVVEKPELLYVAGGEYPLGEYLGSLYNVTRAPSVPADLEEYAAVVVQNRPADQVGDVGALQEHVIDGGGLVVVGGEDAYENGGYGESSLATMLPVRVGNATGGRTNVVLLIDVSGSASGGMVIQKSVALDVLEQLGDRTQVGVVGFNYQAYRVADLAGLGGNRSQVADRIRRLQSGGATDIAVGLRGAQEMLGDQRGTIILLSDGGAAAAPAAAVANQIGTEGTRVIAVGAGRQVDAATLRQIARASGGSYFAADETSRLRLLFGGSSRQFRGQNLTIVTPDTFITTGVELTASPGNGNEVTVKPGADYQVATADGTPAITSWRFGLGRVVSITTYADDGSLGGLLDTPDSLVLTKSVNYAIGDPTRTETGVTSVDDARVGSPATLTYRGSQRPQSPNVTVQQLGPERYRGTFTPRETGYRRVLGAAYAANYPREYGRFGTSRALASLVEATGGREFSPSEPATIARLARQQARQIRTVQDRWGWIAVLAGLLVFASEVIARRLQVYRGHTTLESGLP